MVELDKAENRATVSAMKVILQNALKISRGAHEEYLHSSHRHDYVARRFGDGSSIFLDGGDIFNGGGFYSRSNIYIPEDGIIRDGFKIEDWSLDESSSWSKICERLLWGHRGKDGKQPLTKAPLSTFKKVHLEAILANVENISALHKVVIIYLLETKDFRNA